MTFYQAIRYFLLGVLIFCGFMISVFAEKPSTQTIACNCSETQQIPLYEQSVTDRQLILWANDVAMSSYSLDYMNYRKQLQSIGIYFTPLGWQRYILGLEKSKNLQTIQEKKLVGTAIPTDKPFIRWKGLSDGVFTWRLEIPMLVIFESQDKKIKQHVIVSMFIKRTSNLVGVDNIAIDEFNVREKSRAT